jgi:excisionase family DNA binding protein
VLRVRLRARRRDGARVHTLDPGGEGALAIGVAPRLSREAGAEHLPDAGAEDRLGDQAALGEADRGAHEALLRSQGGVTHGDRNRTNKTTCQPYRRLIRPNRLARRPEKPYTWVMASLLTTQEAAELLGVGPTAIKRWADEGQLVCVRTAGGHRRFRAGDVEALRARGGDAVPARREAEEHLAALRDGEGELLIQARLLEKRAQTGAWHRVAPLAGELLDALGEAWKRGALTILEEHAASERLARALARLAGAIPVGPRAPVGLLVCPEGDEHTLGLSLVELCMREAGWRAAWSGRATPTGEVVRVVEQGGVDAVLASASSWSSRPRPLARWAEAAGAACAARAIPLLLGGTGAWPDPPSYGTRVRDYEALHGFLNRST